MASIGEFFVNLGVKGSEKTLGALTSVKTGISDLSNISLEAKAAILATVYALERLMSSSAKTGTNIQNFNSLTGISGKTLQQYQYAAAQVGISNEEMAGSFKSIQNVMTAMRFGKGAPEGMAMLMGKLGGNFDPNRAKTDTEYVMRKLQEYANLEKDISKRNLVMKSFGLGEGVVAGMARNAFKPEILSKAPVFSDKEVSQLDKVNAAFANLGIKVQMAMGHFTAMHGGKLVKELSMIVDKVIQLTNAFIKMAETIKLFEGIGKVFEGWAKIFEAVTAGVTAVTGAIQSPEKRKEVTGEVTGFFKEMPGVFKAMAEDLFTPGKTENAPLAAPVAQKIIAQSTAPNLSNDVAPIMSSLNNNQKSSTQNNNVNQTFNFQADGSDHKQVGDAAQKAITKAFFQIPQGGY